MVLKEPRNFAIVVLFAQDNYPIRGMTMNVPPKPFLRGHFHQAAFFMALGACLLLLFKSQHFLPTLIYCISLVGLFGTSALYHRINWSPNARMIMRRLDHASIFLLIAGTMTPICLRTLPESDGRMLLLAAWITAGLGIILSILFTKKPKWLNALLCFSAGAILLPYFSQMTETLSTLQISLLISGGIVYVVGAVIYAIKRPNFSPRVFGYHEVFHILVVVAAAEHFAVIHSIV